MAVTARRGRWKSERQAAEYATPPLDWEWELLALLPWPAPDGGAILHATSQMEIWPMAIMGGEASARAKDTAPIPIVISDSSDDSDDGVLGPAVRSDGVHARRRHCQQPRASARTAGGTRHPTGTSPHSARAGANEVRPPPETTSRPTQVPGAAVRRGSTARGEPAGGAHNPRLAHMRAAAGKISSRLRVHERRVMDLLRLWWHTALLWMWDRPQAPEVKKADLQCMRSCMNWR